MACTLEQISVILSRTFKIINLTDTSFLPCINCVLMVTTATVCNVLSITFIIYSVYGAYILRVNCSDGARRRLLFSTCFFGVKATALHCQIPLSAVQCDVWTNLTVHVAGIVESFFPGVSFKSIDMLVLGGAFKVTCYADVSVWVYVIGSPTGV